MFGWFRKKKAEPPKGTQPDDEFAKKCREAVKPSKTSPSTNGNRIDALANKLQKEGRLAVLESELAGFNPSTLVGGEKESWYHLHGIIPFRAGNRQLAFTRFQEGVKQCPDSAILLFSLGQEYEFRGNVDDMIRCFDRAIFPSVPAQYALAEARYAYLWNRNDKGWFYVEALMPAYLKLKILDTTFLYIRGMPFFEQAWAYLAAFSQTTGDFDRLSKITEKVAAECSDCDFEYLKAELEAFRYGEFSPLKAKWRSLIEDARQHNWPSGYQSLRLNILLAQETRDIEEAARLLDSVTLSDKDFPWLDDMRLLAKCEQAHKTSNNTLELDLRSRFLARQPLLFEPDHAINFNLLKYQESLKPDFHKTRTKGGNT
jgi:tetratricopeptide (TPR) repeat protein